MKKNITARNLIVIVRGPQSVHHNAPFHPIIVCSRKHTAKWESMRTENGATVFMNMAPDMQGNWLLVKYKGYDIDYGTMSHYFTLFDGEDSRIVSDKDRVEGMLKHAIWWSYDDMPQWIKDLGVHYAQDDFTKRAILMDSGTCLLTNNQSRKIKDRLYESEEPEWLTIKTT